MGDDELLAREMTRYVDGLMRPDEEREFLRKTDGDAALRAELAAQKKLKEVTDGMRLAQLPDAIWDGYWKGIYRRIERGTGWILLSVGLILIISFGVYHMCADFLLNPGQPLIARIGVGIGALGIIILLVSLGRERYFARQHERYETEVER